MGEYMEPHAVARLIGSPPGYVGFDQGGGLVNKVRNRPYSIIVFDEIEKAHPDILNVLLGILDEGKLTDGQGKTADFCNCIIILTSNLGANRQEEPLGFGEGGGQTHSTVKRAVTKAFKPEFVNRLDEIVVFDPLTPAALEEIAALHLQELEERLLRQGHTVQFCPEIAAEAAKRGFDRRYGARAVRRFIEKEVGSRVAEQLMAGTLPQGMLAAEQIFVHPTVKI
jgi:ATP-dependent Clp protease ATP-binding subunit ClpB